MNVLFFGLMVLCFRQSQAMLLLDAPEQEVEDAEHCYRDDDHPDCPIFKDLCADVSDVRQLCPATCDSCKEVREKEAKMAQLDETAAVLEIATGPKCNDTMVSCPQLVKECFGRVQIRRLCAHTCHACKELPCETPDCLERRRKQYGCPPPANEENEPTLEELTTKFIDLLRLREKFPSSFP